MERVIPFCHPASTFQSVTPKTRGTLDREACQASEEEEEEEEEEEGGGRGGGGGGGGGGGITKGKQEGIESVLTFFSDVVSNSI